LRIEIDGPEKRRGYRIMREHRKEREQKKLQQRIER
jgi:hypothetical protein